MSDCGCEKARKDLEEYLRNEVCSTEAADIREHISNCADCQSEVVISQTLTDVIQRARKERAPEALTLQVLAPLREVHTSPG